MKKKLLNAKQITIGIDASRNRSGGTIAHLTGILSNFELINTNIDFIHIWGYRSLLDKLPDSPRIIKHHSIFLEMGLPFQLFWQAFVLKHEVESVGCSILFTTDASTLCFYRPQVVLSQDMLSYEPGVMSYYGFGFKRLRLIAILLIQNMAFRRADGVIFLTHHAARIIQDSCGKLKKICCIPHGVNDKFRIARKANLHDYNNSISGPIKCIYVSNVEMYKHQWVVIEAIASLRKIGWNISLTLVGGGLGKARQLVNEAKTRCDPSNEFIFEYDFLPNSQLPEMLTQFDIFIFASSCENLPVTLLEGMATGIPIVCSDRGPMPEVLQDGGIYFNPEDASSIQASILQLLNSSDLRSKISSRSIFISKDYNWNRCAKQTFDFIESVFWKGD